MGAWNEICWRVEAAGGGLRGFSGRGLEGLELILRRFFVAAIGGVVIGPVLDGVGQMLLLDLGLVVVVRVAIALAVADLPHERRRRVPQGERNRGRAGPRDVPLPGPVGRV